MTPTNDSATTSTNTDLATVDRWWRAANYLSVGQLYLRHNGLLRRSLDAADVKARLLGHWGTTPGLNFIWAHVNKAILDRDLSALFIAGPGHGGPALVANAWLEGTYSEIYSHVAQDAGGIDALFEQFSFPGGIPSHAAPETPGSLHEGGELGYSLAHGFGAVFDNPDLVAVTVVGDGEAETGPLAGSWLSSAFVNPATDGAVLPVLHLNGYKIANPTVLARMSAEQLDHLLRGYGYDPHVVEVSDPDATEEAHEAFASALSACLEDIGALQTAARSQHAECETAGMPVWPMIVLRSPKGWTGPKDVDGLPVEGLWRAHQVPITEVTTNAEHRQQLEDWMRSYRPGELFDENGRPRPELGALCPSGDRRMSATPFANGGRLLVDLHLPPIRDHLIDVDRPGTDPVSATATLGTWLAAVIAANPRNFRLFGPDETGSNRLQNVYDATDKTWLLPQEPDDEHLSRAGRVMEVLSEHLCQGWLEGYLLTGRHGMFNCYEAFVHIVDSMFNQHAKWLKAHQQLSWRWPIASLTYLLSSHVWQQDHNGFSHQDPGFIDHVVNKRAEVIRIYLPPDANTLLVTADHCLRSRDYVNVIIAGKHPSVTWLDPEAAQLHCARGVGTWDFAGHEVAGEEPDVVLAAAGDVPTIEIVAAAQLIRQHLPAVRVRVINVVDLMRLQHPSEHPHGLPDVEFDALFTASKPVIFAYHGYPWLIHRLTYGRRNHEGVHVRGYLEKGSTTTPFDMAMLNGIDRYSLVMDVMDRVPSLGASQAPLRQQLADARLRARAATRATGADLPEITDWTLEPRP